MPGSGTPRSFICRYMILYGCVLLFALLCQPVQATTLVKAAPSSFWDTGMRLCDVDSSGECDNKDYALSVARFGYGGAACALLSFLVFLVFIPGRCCCNQFGGREPTYGVCCTEDWDSREYTRSEVLAPKIVAFVVPIAIIIGIAIGFAANSNISSSINTVTTSLLNSGDQILADLEEVQAVLLSLPITSSSSAIINNTIQSAQSIQQNMQNAHDTVHQWDGDRNIFMIVAFAFTLSLVLAGVLAALFNLKVLAFATGMVGLLVLTLIWLSFGAHMVASKLVYDVCFDINLLQSNSSSSSILSYGALADLWSCGQNSDFVALQNLVNQSEAAAVNQACSLRAQTCFNATARTGDPQWLCSSSPPCESDTLDIVTDAQHMTIIDGTTNRSLSDCAQNCNNSAYKNASSTIVVGIAQYYNFTQIYNATVYPLVDCQFANEIIADFQDPLCTTLFDSLYSVAVSNIIVGIFYVPFIVVMVVGYKRFMNVSDGVV